jgi:hypothetical protein
MDHRYGRHGPRAWLRQRQQRYARPSLLPTPVVPPTIVRVFVPTNAERIIFIVIRQSEEFDDEKRGEGDTSQIPFPDSRLIGSSQDERTRIYAQLKRTAAFEAGTYYDSVTQNVLDRGSEWPLDETVEREASNKANVALRPFINSLLDLEPAKRFYVDAYLEIFQARYQRDIGDGTLPSEETKQVKELAQRDARKDKQDGAELEEPELTYQAVIHIEHHFGYRTRAASGYLTYIMGHISHYKQAYREEIDRPLRPRPFLGESGKYTLSS